MKVILFVGALLLCLLQEANSSVIFPINQGVLQDSQENNEDQSMALQMQDQGKSDVEDLTTVNYDEVLRLISDVDFLLNEIMVQGKEAQLQPKVIMNREQRFIFAAWTLFAVILSNSVVAGVAAGGVATIVATAAAGTLIARANGVI